MHASVEEIGPERWIKQLRHREWVVDILKLVALMAATLVAFQLGRWTGAP